MSMVPFRSICDRRRIWIWLPEGKRWQDVTIVFGSNFVNYAPRLRAAGYCICIEK